MVGGCQIYHPLREICCHLSQRTVTTLQCRMGIFSASNACLTGWVEGTSLRLSNMMILQLLVFHIHNYTETFGDQFFWVKKSSQLNGSPSVQEQRFDRLENDIGSAYESQRWSFGSDLGALNIDSSSNRLLQVATATGSG